MIPTEVFRELRTGLRAQSAIHAGEDRFTVIYVRDGHGKVLPDYVVELIDEALAARCNRGA